jgi:23S rRNA (uracil1939-C5)-methyltransferase
MTSSLPFNEESYRESKKKNLENLLGESCSNIDWIWIGGHSRRKVTFQINGKNHLGFFVEKSHNLIEIDETNLVEEKISELIPHLKNFLKNQEQNFYTRAMVTLFDSGLDIILTATKTLDFSQAKKLTDFAKSQNLNISLRVKNNITPIFLTRKNQIFYPNFKIDLDSDIFIQATKAGLESIVKIIRNFVRTRLKSRCDESEMADSRAPHHSVLDIREERSAVNPPFTAIAGRDFKRVLKQGEIVADIYAGFGAYSFAIQDLVKSISAFEGDEKMVNLISKNVAANNLGNKIKPETRDLFLNPLTKKELNKFNLAIINPPRNGAAPQVSEISKSALKNLIYVSCNPESFARDATILINSGFKIVSLTALDQFHSTKHLEVVGVFQK